MSINTPIPDFQAMADKLLHDLPQEVANIALHHFKQSFVNQGFTDNSFIPWVKRLDDLTFGYTHDILNKTGDMRDSVVIKQATMKVIEVAAGEGLAYAAIHNNGGTIKVKITDRMRRFFWYVYISLTKHYGADPPEHILKWKMMALTKESEFTINIPKRQYIGESQALLKDIDTHITNKILTTFKNTTNKV